MFGGILILNNILLEKRLILWKNDTSYHISFQSIEIIHHNDMGLGRRNKKKKKKLKIRKTKMTITVAIELHAQHTHDLLQSMEERFTGKDNIFY